MATLHFLFLIIAFVCVCVRVPVCRCVCVCIYLHLGIGACGEEGVRVPGAGVTGSPGPQDVSCSHLTAEPTLQSQY